MEDIVEPGEVLVHLPFDAIDGRDGGRPSGLPGDTCFLARGINQRGGRTGVFRVGVTVEQLLTANGIFFRVEVNFELVFFAFF